MTEIDLDAALHLARTYIESGNVERAGQVLRTALATKPDHHELLTELAHVAIRRKDYTLVRHQNGRILAMLGVIATVHTSAGRSVSVSDGETAPYCSGGP